MINDFKKLIEINRNEVLRYLEYKNQDINEDLNLIIEDCINSTKKIINPRYTYKILSVNKEKMSKEKNRVYFDNENIKLESNDLYKLLNHCDKCIFICATLGIEIEKEIRKLTYTDLTKGIIVDACATTAIEEVCDTIQLSIEKELLKQGKYITMRYSPGYGDLPIEKNKDIISILNSHNRIGLTVTDSGIMIPRKSVVAIIGISNKSKEKHKKSCMNCVNIKNCKFKKGADKCEY